MSGRQRATARHRRLGPEAAAALFAMAGIVLLLVPELPGVLVGGSTPDVFDIVSDIAFLVIGTIVVWYLATRIEAAFRRETDAREAVERRERVLADVIDAVPSAVLLLADTDELAVAHANPAAGRLLDLAPIVEPTRLAAIVPLDGATQDALAAAAAASMPWAGERVITTDGGRRLPIALAITPIARGAGMRAVLVATDRTELHFAERESERLAVELEGFVQTAPVGFITVGPDGLVDAWNGAAERILGWTAPEMIGSRLPTELGSVIAESLAAGAGLPSGARPAGAALPPAAGSAPEIRLHRKSGDPVVVRLTATTAYGRGHDFFGFTAMFEDVTEQRRTEAERDEAESRFRAAVDASPVPLVLLDPEGKVRLWSAAAERLFGWTAGEAMGRLFPAVPDEELPGLFARLERVLGGASAGGELRGYVGRDGHTIQSRVWSAPVRAADGSVVGVMDAFRTEPEAEAPGG
jgi:PAS domain S-box-containing protein